MAGRSFDFCLERCLEECLCKSFQVCSGECELSSIEKDEDASAFRTRLGCVYYKLEAPDVSSELVCKMCSYAKILFGIYRDLI